MYYNLGIDFLQNSLRFFLQTLLRFFGFKLHNRSESSVNWTFRKIPIYIFWAMDYGHMKAKSPIICGPNSNPNPQINIWDVDINAWFSVKIMIELLIENMDKGLTVPKWVLIVRPKIPQMPQNLSAQVLDFNEKSLRWASVVRGCTIKCRQIQSWT